MENALEENARQLEVVEAVKGYNPEFVKSCYAVGAWIWAEFTQRLSTEELEFLKGLGFRWNPVRKVWQNACGVKTRRSNGEPRLKYQVISFSEN
ncbi:hypothetical protein AUJ64_00400 [Candidatus Pacearchaeota archaeon CG1_02_39_14]|nr:MAG: hypothetical protein AUJ64_00400 [Candidatus Pacearchaeota archaeon CG1_02_39_14]